MVFPTTHRYSPISLDLLLAQQEMQRTQTLHTQQREVLDTQAETVKAHLYEAAVKELSNKVKQFFQDIRILYKNQVDELIKKGTEQKARLYNKEIRKLAPVIQTNSVVLQCATLSLSQQARDFSEGQTVSFRPNRIPTVPVHSFERPCNPTQIEASSRAFNPFPESYLDLPPCYNGPGPASRPAPSVPYQGDPPIAFPVGSAYSGPNWGQGPFSPFGNNQSIYPAPQPRGDPARFYFGPSAPDHRGPEGGV